MAKRFTALHKGAVGRLWGKKVRRKVTEDHTLIEEDDGRGCWQCGAERGTNIGFRRFSDLAMIIRIECHLACAWTSVLKFLPIPSFIVEK